MPINMITSYKAKKIGEINKQLVNEFHPAVKNVAIAGHNLVRAYESVNKAFYIYTASLYGLSHSGKNTEPEAREHADQLQQTAESLKTIYSEHFKWVDHFANVIAVINHNNESEKERLKMLCQAYAKKEKLLIKAVDKGKQTHSELDNFYETQLALSVDQQYQRYKFFSQCHSDLLKKHLEWSKFSADVLEKHFDSQASDPQHEQTHLDELYQHAEEQQQRILAESEGGSPLITNAISTSNVRRTSLDIYYNRLKASSKEEVARAQRAGSTGQDVVAENNGQESHGAQLNGAGHYEKGKSPRSLRKEFEQHRNSQASSSPIISHRHSQNKSNASSEAGGKPSSDGGRESQLYLTNNNNNSVEIFVRGNQSSDHPTYDDRPVKQEEVEEQIHQVSTRLPHKVLPSNIYKATPIVALLQQQQQQQQAKRSSYVEERGAISASPYLDNRKSTPNLPVGDHQRPIGDDLSNLYQQFREVHQQQQQTSPTPYIPPAQRTSSGGGVALKSLEDHQEVLRAVRPTHPPPAAQKPQLVSAVSVTSSDGTSIHTRDKSLDKSQDGGSSSRPSSANRMSQPIFSTADYGRMVECITGYAGQGDNQLTMDIGERVILVKCGTRGWVLGRSEDGARQGWFPAKFLKLL